MIAGFQRSVFFQYNLKTPASKQFSFSNTCHVIFQWKRTQKKTPAKRQTRNFKELFRITFSVKVRMNYFKNLRRCPINLLKAINCPTESLEGSSVHQFETFFKSWLDLKTRRVAVSSKMGLKFYSIQTQA